jgi:hypothetical protein
MFSRDVTHLLVIIHPFTIRALALELYLSERSSTLDSRALPDPLEDKGNEFSRHPSGSKRTGYLP